jgi:Ca2+-binding RTX toxin-like protein
MTVFVGGNGNDVFPGPGQSNGGDDNLRGTDGNDTLSGGAGNDVIDGGNDQDVLDGGSGDDTIYGGVGDDIIFAGTGADTIYGDGGQDVRYGRSEGSDHIYIVDPRIAYINSGTNNDIDYLGIDFRTSTTGVYIDFRQFLIAAPSAGIVHQNNGNLTGNIDGIDRIEFVFGSAYDDYIVFNQYLQDLTYSNNGANGLPQSDGAAVDGGGGNDFIVGGYGSDNIKGGAGSDTIYGNIGNDRIDGGSGDDQIDGQNGNDVLFGSQGFDTIYGGDGDDTISGGDDGDNLYSGSGVNIVNGDAGNDYLVEDGPGNTRLNGGIDDDILSTQFLTAIMDGGSGTDSAVIDMSRIDAEAGSKLDLRTFVPGQQFDLRLVSPSQTTTGTGSLVNVELIYSVYASYYGSEIRLNDATGETQLFGSAYTDRLFGNNMRNVVNAGAGADTVYAGGGNDWVNGGAGNDIIFGDAGDDVLNGEDGNDVLVGGAGVDIISGGLGSNEIYGGTGDDVFIVANAGDTILEYANEGIDAVQTALAGYTLRDNIENLTFTSNTSHGGIGNALDNRIVGGTAYDELFGLGGNDTLTGGSGAANALFGGTGNDTYIVTVRGDSTIEYANEGTDTVRTELSLYVLQNNVEDLIFTDDGTHAGAGNAEKNFIIGGTGADELNGLDGNDTIGGGWGAANTLLGGKGDDVIYANAVGDSVIEYFGEGNDTVFTTLNTFYLRDNVENLMFLGTGSFSGIGSADDNLIAGGASADFLSGMDGNDILIGTAGADLLIGGNGADQFWYEGGETGYDRIIDFTPGLDKIVLLQTGFTHTETFAFVSGPGAVASSSNSTFLYDTNTGIVSYDVDGSGGQAAVQLAQLNTGLTLTVGDFIFV